MEMKIAVYSCITGGYENFRHNQQRSGADFFMFSDRYEYSRTWKFIKATELFKDPRRNARYHKILPHLYFPDYDVWFWMDGSLELKASPEYLVREWMPNYDITAFKHPDRTCVYDEAIVVKGKGYDYPELIDKQMKRYEKEGFPKRIGLSETKVVIRYNTPKMVEFNKMWHWELMNNSLRDQLSFDYCIWNMKMRLHQVPSVISEEQEAFVYYKHNEARTATRYGR